MRGQCTGQQRHALQHPPPPPKNTPQRTYTAICKVELLSRMAQDLHVKVDEECAYHVLVRLADALPQGVVPLDDLIPLRLGRRCVLVGQAVRQQPLHRTRLVGWGLVVQLAGGREGE